MRISGLSEQWIGDRLASGSVAATTAASYRYHFAGFLDVVGDMEVDELTTEHLRAWMRSMAHRSPSTRYVRLSAMASFLDWCVREGIIDANPADRVERPKLKRGRPRPVPAEVARAIIARTTDHRTQLMILLAVEMGLRRSEIASVQVDNIDWFDKTLIVKGKGDKERILPLTSGVSPALVAYLNEHGITGGWLFPSARNPREHLRPDWVGRVISRAAARAGARGVTTHQYRHRAGTDVAASDGIMVAQYLLGHANISTTQIYAQSDLEAARKAVGGRNFAA